MCSRTCELVESVAPYPKTSTEELNQCGCHKRCPRGVPEAKQSCLHDLFGFFYRCRCHEHVSLLNLLLDRHVYVMRDWRKATQHHEHHGKSQTRRIRYTWFMYVCLSIFVEWSVSHMHWDAEGSSKARVSDTPGFWLPVMLIIEALNPRVNFMFHAPPSKLKQWPTSPAT